MKLTRAYYLSFNNTSIASTNINIPFKVKNIHVKMIGYDVGNIPAVGTSTYVVLTSSTLCDNSPLGLLYNDTSYYAGGQEDINIELSPPRYIQGTYDFQLLAVDGVPYIPTGGGIDRLAMILEFAEEDHD